MIDSGEEARIPKKPVLLEGGRYKPENVKRILMGEPKSDHPSIARRRAHAKPQTDNVVEFRSK